MEVGEDGDYMEIIYLSLHCYHQNDSCIKTGSDETHFNPSLIVRVRVTRQCPQTTTFLKRKESRSGIESRSFRFYQPNALPLGQTGSQETLHYYISLASLIMTSNTYLAHSVTLMRLQPSRFAGNRPGHREDVDFPACICR